VTRLTVHRPGWGPYRHDNRTQPSAVDTERGAERADRVGDAYERNRVAGVNAWREDVSPEGIQTKDTGGYPPPKRGQAPVVKDPPQGGTSPRPDDETLLEKLTRLRTALAPNPGHAPTAAALRNAEEEFRRAHANGRICRHDAADRLAAAAARNAAHGRDAWRRQGASS